MTIKYLNKSSGNDFGDDLKIERAYYPYCGTLEGNASIFGVYKRWRNKLEGRLRHQRDGGGDKSIRDIIWGVELQDITHQVDKIKPE